ncbi:HA1F protein, partial [Crotophaga sulcirostris]|nr:HA1F protein [Crotophaga sulcirostris]
GPHSLHYHYTTVSEPSPGLPRFVSMGYVDGTLVTRYDSETGRTVPQADWVEDILDQQHWATQTKRGKRDQEYYQECLDILPGRYNQSGGEWVYTLQRMYGCDILENGNTSGFFRGAYNGHDVVVFDLDTVKFIVLDTKAKVTKKDWEQAGMGAKWWKHFLENTCIKWLRKYLSYGQAVLERKERPMVRVSGKEVQGILTLHCQVYGFYPRSITVNWLKDGEVRDQETERSIIAPNSDGTYYTSASIDVRPEEKDKYWCSVEHASLAEPGLFAWGECDGLGHGDQWAGGGGPLPLLTALFPPEMESNLSTIVLTVVAAILAVTAVITGFALWKFWSGKSSGVSEAKGCGRKAGGQHGPWPRA